MTLVEPVNEKNILYIFVIIRQSSIAQKTRFPKFPTSEFLCSLEFVTPAARSKFRFNETCLCLHFQEKSKRTNILKSYF